MFKFLPTSGFKWIDHYEFDLNKYTSNILEYPKEIKELHNDYPLAPDKIEIKRKILSENQLKIAALYNILIGNGKNLVPNFFDKKNMLFIMKTRNFS